MFDQNPEYSSDVEWLLQDKQANESTILKVLVAEHYERTLQLALLVSLDTDTANLITCETFANALVSRHRYTSDQEVQEWLDQILINHCKNTLAEHGSSLNGGNLKARILRENGWKTDSEIEVLLWRCLDSLPLSERIPYLLNAILYIPVPSVARLLGLKERAASERLEAARKQMLAEVNGRATADPSYDEANIAASLSSSLGKHWEAEQAVTKGAESMIPAIQTLVEDKRYKRRRQVILQEILLVAIVVVLVFTLVQVAVSLSAEPNARAIPPDLLISLIPAYV